MDASQNPVLSVVIVTPDGFEAIHHTVACLDRQTVRATLELVVVAPSVAALRLADGQLSALRERFARVEIVELGNVHSIGRANAAGIRRASAPVVALAEDHCFPAPGWAEHLLEAHRGPWAAVGPAVSNANPRSAVSWADLFIGYGPWLAPTTDRQMEFLPGHNTSYKRDVLLAYGSRLESMMEAETLLHWDLRRNGYRLFLAAAATAAHTNFSLWRSWLPVQYHNGRLFAGARVRGMTWWRRTLFVAGAPVIPVLRLARIWKGLRSREHRRQFIACLHALVVGLILDGAGQLVGYAAGVGSAVDRVARYEFRRSRHIRDDDRRDLALA